MRIAAAALLGVVMLPAATNADLPARPPASSHPSLSIHRHAHDAPYIRLWLAHTNLFQRGERAQLYFRTDDDAHVLVVRIDTDGRLQVLFPESPHNRAPLRANFPYRVAGQARGGFVIDDYPGMGYVFALASWAPFDLRALTHARHSAHRRVGWRIDRDPFVAMHDFAERVLFDPAAPYSLDYVEYHVDGRRDYPRFLCYNCHAYRPYATWNPYHYSCALFRVVVYDRPHYYAYRYRRGSRVVYARAPRPAPRYEFERRKDGLAIRPEDFVERRRREEDPLNRRRRRAVERPEVRARPDVVEPRTSTPQVRPGGRATESERPIARRRPPDGG